MLQTKNLTYHYSEEVKIRLPDIDLNDGENALILGPSGSGKTTLLHLLGGLMTPKEGDILMNNTSLSNLSGRSLDTFRGKNIGIVFQGDHFVQSLSILENLELCQKLGGSKVDSSFCQSLLDQLNIGHKSKSKSNQLSQGQRQRASIARALVNKPLIILADEPTSALDDINCNAVINLLLAQAKQFKAHLVVVTHDHRIIQHFNTKYTLENLMNV